MQNRLAKIRFFIVFFVFFLELKKKYYICRTNSVYN